MNEIDKTFEVFSGLSNLAQLNDLVRVARRAGAKTCGHCEHWMKSKQCPKEHNVNGQSRGPSSDEIACEKYVQTTWSKAMKSKAETEAKEFAKQCLLLEPKF